MATAPLTAWMSVEQYLSTAFRPDVDYVDGFVEERKVGEWDHARLQQTLLRIFGEHEEDWDIYVVPEVRTQIGKTRFRVPDVCVTDARSEVEQIVRRPPLLCVEILSPEDRLPRVFERVQDYHRMGVQAVWIFDPGMRRVWVSTPDGVEEHVGGLLGVVGTKITLDPNEAFERAARRR